MFPKLDVHGLVRVYLHFPTGAMRRVDRSGSLPLPIVGSTMNQSMGDRNHEEHEGEEDGVRRFIESRDRLCD